MITLALLIGLAGFFFGEKAPQAGSLGDEKYYLLITKFFQPLVFEHGLDDYRLQRILPCALVHYSLKLFSIPLTIDNIVHAFGFINVLLLGLIAYVWCLISDEIRLSQQGRWLGAIALFCNFHILKYIPYIQVSTDLFAYAITLSLIYFYLKNNVWALLSLVVIGSFIWPTILYTGTILILFPRDQHALKETSPAPLFLNFALPIGLSVFVLWKMQMILKVLHSGAIYAYGIFSMGSNRPIMSVIYVSIGIVIAYLFATLSPLFNQGELYQGKYWTRHLRPTRWIMAVSVIMVVKLILYYGAVKHDARPLDYLITNLLIVSAMQPGAFLVSHVMYFGPVVLFLFFLWKPFCRLIQECGPGLLLCMVLVVVFALDSESRKQMNTFPFLVPFLIKAMDQLTIKRIHFWVLGLLSLVFSKVWLPIHAWPWSGKVLEFPDQFYYMNMGPWMSHAMYALQGGIVILTAAAIYFIFIRNQEVKI
ncbi:MAG: hypothetical protein ABIJ41_05680 [Candidatus Omnitrophota bacterium]